MRPATPLPQGTGVGLWAWVCHVGNTLRDSILLVPIGIPSHACTGNPLLDLWFLAMAMQRQERFVHVGPQKTS